MTIRTRFAPSPTGALHVGTVRTALFAWLYAKQHDGQFILRIEDTDQKREVPGGVQNITDTLQWLGLQWDEGPDIGGPYAPYTQSKRLEIYKSYAEQLLQQGHAYADPYTPEELQKLREQAHHEKRPFLYRRHRPEHPPTWDGTQPLRIKLEPKAWEWDDAIMGTIHMGAEMIDDFIIMKADGFPTYNFCHIIDDHLMGITHIMRSQEFLSSIPKFLATHELLGWEPPVNITLPPVLDETGKRKLSKRYGAKPLLDYRKEGFLPEALINFMATIGWNDGTEQEIFSTAELLEKFSIGRVQRSGGIFDEKRLLWLNGAHIRRLHIAELYEYVADFWPAQAASASAEYKTEVLHLVHERLKFFAELPALTTFFFEDPNVEAATFAENKQLKKLSETERHELLAAAKAELEASDFTHDDIEARLRSLVEKRGTKPGILFGILRVAITGSNVAPGLFETMQVLGKTTTLNRLDKLL